MSIVLIVLLFSILATMLPEAETAGDTLNESGVPFGSFFAAGGIVFVIIMAGMLMKVVGSFLGKGRK